MKKTYYKTIPFLILTLIINAATKMLESYLLIRMAALFDLCIQGDMGALYQDLPTTITLIAALIPISIANGYVGVRYSQSVNCKLKKQLIVKILSQNFVSLRRIGKDKLISYATHDLQTIESDYTLVIFRIGSALCSLAGAIWLLVSASVWMLLVAFLVVAINIGISYAISKPSGNAYLERKGVQEGYASYVKEFLSSFAVIYSNNLQEKMNSDFQEKLSRLDNNMTRIKRMLNRIGTTENLLVTATSYASICVVGAFSASGLISLGGFLVALQGLLNLPTPLGNIVELFPSLFGGKAVLNKIDKDLAQTGKDSAAHVKLLSFKDRIEFSEVHFSYEASPDDVLRVKTLSIEKGKKYLICGPSGGGKSTLLRLVQRMYKPTQGCIRIDGVEISEVDEECYFKFFSHMEQSVFLFEDTILNNITLGRDISNQTIEKVIEISGLTEFIASQPEGLRTMILNGGKNISGGQRSRIAIARALAAGAPILILDEAFSSLDREQAMRIERQILLMNDITLLNVSHVILEENQKYYDYIIHTNKDVYSECAKE